MIKQKIAKLIEQSVRELQKTKKLPNFPIPEIRLEYPKEKTYGDYATNIAMVIAKQLKTNPFEVAENIKSQILRTEGDLFEKVEIAQPGFINFFLSQKTFFEETNKIIKEKEKYGSQKIGKGKAVIIDYSSPNIAKPFGIGHLRSTIIGQTIYNIYKFLGFKTIGDNHLGDWGTQYGKLLYMIEKKLDKKTAKEKKAILKNLTIAEMEKLYVDFHKEAEKNPLLEEEARKYFKKLEAGDKELKKLWKICKEKSLKEFKKIYKILDVKIDYSYGESFYQPMLNDIIEEVKEKGVAKKSQGALIIQYPEDNLPPAVFLKSDGAATYLARDLAAIKFRLKKWKPYLIIYEVGADQTLYFKQLFKTVELLGWAKKEKFIHIAHGLIRTKEGKFSTRKGKTIHLEQVLNEAKERAGKIIEKLETAKNLTETEKEKVAKIVGIGGVKYNDLASHYSRDIIFDWDKILNLKGNSGPYLQYTVVRAQSVFKKGKIKKIPKLDANSIKKLEKEEEDILRIIYQFPEIVEEAAKIFSPNLICNFAYNLAQKYNLFYEKLPILKAPDKNIRNLRLIITYALAQVLKNSLSLLGILVPQKM